MPLGGFAPLPLRLGGSAEQGWTAQQHARACADLVALLKTAPFALLDLQTGASTLHGYVGQHGIGIEAGPVITSGTGFARATWDDGYVDPFGQYQATRIKGAYASTAFYSSNFCVETVDSAKQVTVRAYSAAGANAATRVFVVVW